MKIVVALEDLKINAMYKVKGKKESFFKENFNQKRINFFFVRQF